MFNFNSQKSGRPQGLFLGRVRASVASAFLGSALLALSGCGGGGGGGAVPAASSTSSTISGVAATGAAMASATVVIKDVTGKTATTTTDANGAYTFDVTSLTAPFVITATVQVGDSTLKLTSVVAQKPEAGTSSTANITPLTNAMVALIVPSGNPADLEDIAVLQTAATKANIDGAAAKVIAVLINILTDAGLDTANFNPVSTVFTANRKGVDRVLELVRVEFTGLGIILTNSAAPDDGNGSASVPLTATSTPTALPAPPAGTVLGTLDHLATLTTACFKDAAAVRVATRDASGIAATLSAACDAVPFSRTYKSGGYTASQRYDRRLSNDDYTGATFSNPEALFTDPDGTVFFRMPFKTVAGEGGIFLDVARKTSPAGKTYQWEIVGNQRDYDSTVETRLDNITQLNPNNAQEIGRSQYRVALRLYFDPSNTGGKNVQTVRVKGPGLPATGIVMHRSNICGNNDFMTITNKTGLLLNTSNSPILFNGSGANSFRLAAESKSGAVFDWSKISTSSSWRSAPMTDAELAAIPSFAEYTFELWTFGAGFTYRNTITNATAPDVTYKQRLTSRPPAIGALKTLPWNTLTASGFLDPANALAAGQASTTVNWTPVAEPVDSVSSGGQKFTATTVPAQATSIIVNGDTGATSVKISARSATVAPGTEVTGLESLRGISGTTITIPSCSLVQYPALDAVAGTRITGTDSVVRSNGTFRDQTVRGRAFNLTRKYVTNSWNNFID